jgi:hypothetical protein
MTSTVDFGVKFGRHPDMGLEGQKAFPFIYTFINRNDDQWAAHASLTNQTDALDNIVKGIGPLIPANSRITHNVMLDPDYIFKLLSIKYSVYHAYEVPPNGAPGHFDSYQWYENLSGNQSDGVDPDTDKIGTPLTQFIGMTLSFSGSQSAIMYGGDDQGAVPRMINGNRREPLPVESIQGYDYGYLTLRTPRLLPQQACLIFEISNTHATKDLVVGAAIYGLKIRL